MRLSASLTLHATLMLSLALRHLKRLVLSSTTCSLTCTARTRTSPTTVKWLFKISLNTISLFQRNLSATTSSEISWLASGTWIFSRRPAPYRKVLVSPDLAAWWKTLTSSGNTISTVLKYLVVMNHALSSSMMSQLLKCHSAQSKLLMLLWLLAALRLILRGLKASLAKAKWLLDKALRKKCHLQGPNINKRTKIWLVSWGHACNSVVQEAFKAWLAASPVSMMIEVELLSLLSFSKPCATTVWPKIKVSRKSSSNKSILTVMVTSITMNSSVTLLVKWIRWDQSLPNWLSRRWTKTETV